MKRAVFLHIESILRDYPRMNDYIKQRLNNKYYSLGDDKAVSVLIEQQMVVKNCLVNSSEDDQELIDSLYFHHDPNKTIDGVAMDLNISRSALFYKRNKFMEAIKRGLGW